MSGGMTIYHTILLIGADHFEVQVSDLPNETWSVDFRELDERLPRPLRELISRRFPTSAEAERAVEDAVLTLEGAWKPWRKL